MKLGSRIAAGLLTVSLGALVGSQPLTVQESPWRCPAARSLIAELEGPLAHVRYLADDLLEGRAVATRGERCAGDYIAARFRALGLEPAGDGDSFFQAWMVRTGSETGDGNSFAVSGDAPARFVLGADWTPYGFSASARVGALMAVVPAVTDGQLEDSGHGTLAGKALVIEGAAPHPHAAPVDAHRVGSSAAGMGAAAVIILLGDSDPLPPLADERRAPLAVQVVAVRGAAAADAAILDRANDQIASPLDLRYNSDGFGASDHSSFHARGIPVLHFFSNTHPEYHRVEDDWELINADGMARVTELVTAVAREVVPGAGLASLTPVEGAGNPHGMQGPADGSTVRSGFSVRLGTIPDYSRESGGMGVTGVRDASPAAKAGIQGGDIIVKFGPHDVEDVYGYMYALGEFEPGDEVDVVVLRDGERLVFSVVLEAGGG